MEACQSSNLAGNSLGVTYELVAFSRSLVSHLNLAGNSLGATHPLDALSRSLISHPTRQGIAWEQLTSWTCYHAALSVMQLGGE